MRAVLLVLAIAACGGSSAPAPAPPSTVPVVGEGEALPFVQVARDAIVGHRAPAAQLEMLDGSHVDLSRDLGRRPIYLKFWATWCVPCREQMPHLEATFRAHGDAMAIYAVDVGIDDPIENVRAFAAKKQLAVPVAVDRDGSVAEAFHLNVTPQHVVIDRAGVVRYVGHAVTPELEAAIAAVLAERAPTAADATAQPIAVTPLPSLALDDHTALDLAARPHAPLALTFATLFCDSYIAESRPEIGATCAAHARALEAAHRAHPELAWVTVAYPVWTSPDDITEYRKRLGATTPIGIDRGNAWFRKFAVHDTYITVLLDASGTEIGRVSGDGAGLAALVAKLPQ